ncbi:uncharacterized protein [Montipora foliosa]|uniref:uncharacterized protein n=1 Tax=Montipora foliosa TaxID=591990 RepID=UPI0035F1E942
MSDSDGYMSSSESSNVQESDSSDEMEVVGLVEPYADEPPAHSSDDEEDSEEDLDGHSPAVLHARFERQVAVKEWYLRAVAFRWLIRWICGYMGLDNTRPLPACVYHNIRQKFQTVQARVYEAAQQRG